jgi:trk system potassium uptake protein TrkA
MKIIIIGCGRMGSGLAQALTLRGHTITVVDTDPAAFERLGPAFKGRTVVGIGFDRDVLIQAGIERADGLAALTESDEANAVAARMASQIFRVPRVVARLYDPRKAEIYRRLGLRTIAPVTWAVNRMADQLCFTEMERVVTLGSEVDIMDVEVPALLVGRTVNELTSPGEIQVVAVSRGGKTFLPTFGTVFQEGDLVHLAVLSSSVDRLRSLLAMS